MKLSIIIPVYNEAKTIKELLRRINKVDLGKIKKEIILVDDYSTDGSRDILKELKGEYIKIFQDKNKGKGSAIRAALSHTTGDIVMVQDADLEYDPKDYLALIDPILQGKADVVYGSRLLGQKSKYAKFSYYVAGRSLTIITNLLYGIDISDEPCGYKVFSSDVIKKIKLRCKRFEFCPEITAKISKKSIKIHEVPTSYNPRSRKEGKKIKFWDWLEAVYVLVKYRFFN
tara:strand:+ start:9152 stop:9838 length:687 start_codon:yes stop_codon:yes gene_type:complete